MAEKRNRLTTLWTRRDFLRRSAWGMVVASLGIATVGSVRLLFPRARFTPRTTITLGTPDDFVVGEISAKWKDTHQLILVRNEEGFYALRAVCTHLGCIPTWKAAPKKFKCPCHGSGFLVSGINFEGPAPRPLERFKIFLDEAGRVTVDRAYVYRWERAEWDREGAFLPYSGGQTSATT